MSDMQQFNMLKPKVQQIQLSQQKKNNNAKALMSTQVWGSGVSPRPTGSESVYLVLLHHWSNSHSVPTLLL